MLPKVPVEVRVHPDAERLIVRAGQVSERTASVQIVAVRFLGLGLFAVAVAMLFLGARIGRLIQAERP